MASRYLVFAVLVFLAVPAWASDGVAPQTNSNLSMHDRLVDTPMTCMMPPLPSLSLGYGGTAVDAAKAIATEATDFMQDGAIYLGCLATKARIAAVNFYYQTMETIRTKMNNAQSNKQNAVNSDQ